MGNQREPLAGQGSGWEGMRNSSQSTGGAGQSRGKCTHPQTALNQTHEHTCASVSPGTLPAFPMYLLSYQLQHEHLRASTHPSVADWQLHGEGTEPSFVPRGSRRPRPCPRHRAAEVSKGGGGRPPPQRNAGTASSPAGWRVIPQLTLKTEKNRPGCCLDTGVAWVLTSAPCLAVRLRESYVTSLSWWPCSQKWCL